MHGQGHGKIALALCLVGISQSGCDIVQGFRDASSAVFPEEKTYFDAPGFRLVRGEYRGLEFASGTGLYLLARPPDPEDHTLWSMRYEDPRPCPLRNVKAHQNGAGAFKDATTIAYTEEGEYAGTLRFADGECKIFDLVVKESALPLAESPLGFLVYESGNLILVNPVSGTSRMVAPKAKYVGNFSGYYVIFSDDEGRIGAFDSEWREVRWVGEKVVAVGNLGQAFIYEDVQGIHRFAPTGGIPPVADTVIAPGACKLGFPRVLGGTETWASYYQPCDSRKLFIYGDTAARASELAIAAADPWAMAFLPAYPSQGGDPAVDPFYVFFLTDVGPGALGTLRMRSPDLQTRTLGTAAPLDRLVAFPSAAETHGFALLDVDNEAGVGKFVRWEVDGGTSVVAEKAVRGTGDLVVDFDGTTGRFILPTDKGYSTITNRVPAYGFRTRDPRNRWTAIVDNFEDSMGSISITDSTLDFTSAAATPSGEPTLEPIVQKALWDYRAQFVHSLPGFAYMVNH